jgi:ankyrin repeat protein
MSMPFARCSRTAADPNQAAPDGSTAVHWAVHGDNLAMLNALLAAGAKPNVVTRYKVAPLTLAAQNGNAAVVERLLAVGVNPDTASEEGQTALMTAARNGTVAAVRALLKRGAQVNLAESVRGQTALMFAAGEGNTDAARLLLEFGAKLNERSKGGYTPLLFAVRNNRYETVTFLLKQGADVNDKIPDGTSALSIAILNADFRSGGDAVGLGRRSERARSARPSAARGRLAAPAGRTAGLCHERRGSAGGPSSPRQAVASRYREKTARERCRSKCDHHVG